MRSIRRAALCLGLWICATANALEGQNLLVNSAFATDLDAWTQDSGNAFAWAPLDANNSATSGAALATNSGEQAGAPVGLSQCVALSSPNIGISFRSRYRIASGQGRAATVKGVLDFHDADNCAGNDLGAAAVASDPQNEFDAWLFFELGIEAPAGARSVRAILELVKVQAGGSVQGYFDDVSLAYQVRVTVAVSASLAGRNNTFYRTELSLFANSETLPALVALRHRCPIDVICPSEQFPRAGIVFLVPPRQFLRYPDILATIGDPGTYGSIELTYDGNTKLAVSTRISSSLPLPTIGTIVPAMASTQARTQAVLIGLVSTGGSPATGYRSNVGAYNPNDSPVPVTMTLYDLEGDNPLGRPFSRTLAPNEPFQLNDVFAALGADSTVTANAYLVVRASAPIFSYATVIDNRTGDFVYIAAADDSP